MSTTTTPTPSAPTIFDQTTAVQILQANRLTNAVQRLAPDAVFSPDYLWFKLRASEKLLSDKLRTWFQPRECVPDTALPCVLDNLLAANPAAIIEYEPGYDYNPSYFSGNTWGLTDLRQRPIITVRRMWFQYPTPNNQIWDVPIDWIRPDKKRGIINLVPTQNTVSMPLNAYLLSVLGGGMNIPLMLQVQYAAGLENTLTEWPEIVDVIYKMTVLSILDDLYLPTSFSQSIDGLSQSLSFDPSKVRDSIEETVKAIRSKLQGVRMFGI